MYVFHGEPWHKTPTALRDRLISLELPEFERELLLLFFRRDPEFASLKLTPSHANY